jgi:hypothetical protein
MLDAAQLRPGCRRCAYPQQPFTNLLRSKVVYLIVLSCLIAAAFPLLVFGQAGTGGTILGTVTDPSGAVIPGVTVTITNTDTNQSQQVTTNSVGQYVVPDLRIGHYTVRATASGFKAAEQAGIALNVGDRDRVDFKLEVGSTQESVTVEANPVAVQSESGEVSQVINGQQVTQLATNGRSLYELATLIPGASSNMVDFQNPTPVGGDATVSFNGMRVSHNLYMIDGGEDLDRGGSGNISVMPSIDAIAEFRQITSNYSAEYGLSSSATTTMVFKSGTKQLHASLWEFNRNDAFDAGNFFTNAAGQKAPELRFNLYGFNVGGPVFIPKVYNKDKQKTFFFYNMEWRKLIIGQTLNQTVPLPSEYGGAFPANIPIHAPSASQISPALQGTYSALGISPSAPFPNNTIPPSLLDPNAQVLLKTGIFPAPNNGAQFVGGQPIPTNVREEIVRIDQRFSDKFSMFGHWVAEQISQTYGTSQWSGDNVPTVGDVFGNPSYSGVIHATWSISPTLLNETAFNYDGNRIAITPTGIYQRPSNLNIPELFPGNNDNRIPGISLSGRTGATYDVASWPWHNRADDYQIRDDITWIKGPHELKIGAAWMLYKKIQDLFGDTQGSFNFNGSYTGNDFADFLLGYANSYTELAVQDAGHWDSKSYDAYFQDNWKVNSRLTLNLGLRWDGIPHTYEENNRMSNFYPGLYNPADAAILLPNGTISPSSPGLGTSPNPILKGYQFYLNGMGIAGQNGIPDGLVQNDWALFGPRLGFAYDLTGAGKTVLRGGFGVMYERIQGNDVYNAGPNIPFSSSVTFNNVALSNPNLSLLTGQIVTAPITAASIVGLAYTDYKNPSSDQYSLGIQQQLSGSSVLSVEYVGNIDRHQNDYRQINLPPDNPSLLAALATGSLQYNQFVEYPGYHSIAISEDAENANYNSLQVSLRSQLRNDLMLQLAYTYSKAMDPATGYAGDGDLSYVSDPYNRHYDYGPSGLDRTQVAVINFVYDLPFFKNSSNLFAKNILGGWELSAVGTMETGLPLWVTLGGTYGSNGIANATNRPNVVAPLSYPDTIAQWFSTSTFAPPAPGFFGDLGKNAVRGPGRDNWNISLFKNWTLSEARNSSFQLRFESFNTFNHTQFNNVSSAFSASNFGQVTTVWDPRVFQFGAKLYF